MEKSRILKIKHNFKHRIWYCSNWVFVEIVIKKINMKKFRKKFLNYIPVYAVDYLMRSQGKFMVQQPNFKRFIFALIHHCIWEEKFPHLQKVSGD